MAEVCQRRFVLSLSMTYYRRPQVHSSSVNDQTLISDGRNRRSQHSRQKIIEAIIDLVREGAREPTAEQVAERAGLAMRTVFRHFNDMDSLYREISRRMQDEARDLLGVPAQGASWRETLHNTLDQWARLYEKLLPMRLASDALRHRSPFLQQDHARFIRMARQRLNDVLPAAIAADKSRFEAIDALLSYEVWIRLRRDQRLSAENARNTLHAAVDKLVSGS
jgi:AcrR family transcriptional regulator